jgi:hypothetical protein
VGWIVALHQKPSCQGSVLVNETWVVLNSDLGDIVEEGYIKVERLGGGKQAVHKGAGAGPKPKNGATGAWVMKCGGHSN